MARMWRELGEDYPDREPRYTRSGVLLEEPGDEKKILDNGNDCNRCCNTCGSWHGFKEPEGPLWIQGNNNHGRQMESFIAGPDSIQEIRKLLAEWGGCTHLQAITHEDDLCEAWWGIPEELIEEVVYSNWDRQLLKDIKTELQKNTRGVMNVPLNESKEEQDGFDFVRGADYYRICPKCCHKVFGSVFTAWFDRKCDKCGAVMPPRLNRWGYEMEAIIHPEKNIKESPKILAVEQGLSSLLWFIDHSLPREEIKRRIKDILDAIGQKESDYRSDDNG